MKRIFLLSIVLFCTNCNIVQNDFLEPQQDGIKFEIFNGTNIEYLNTEVIIGGVDEEEKFVIVDSYSLPLIKPGLQQVLDGFDDKRWKPDFEKIKTIGDGKAFFKFQFEGKEANFIEYVNNPEFYLHIDLKKHPRVFDNLGDMRLDISDRSPQLDKNGDLVFGNLFGIED